MKQQNAESREEGSYRQIWLSSAPTSERVEVREAPRGTGMPLGNLLSSLGNTTKEKPKIRGAREEKKKGLTGEAQKLLGGLWKKTHLKG